MSNKLNNSILIKNNKILKSLALQLAKNSVNISLWDLINSRKSKVYSKVFNKSLKLSNNAIECPERFIIMVGAGASYNAYKQLSLGNSAASDLKLLFDIKLGSGLIDEELNRLERVFRLNKSDFETILLAISKFFPVELKNEIIKRYDHRYFPNLTYEIIAHLLKHRFVDAVINFNYDELLDQAIEDELGHEEYKRIIVEGDFQDSFLTDDTGLRHPIYLKPHGTSSNRSSLKFTREDYFTLSPSISGLITMLLQGVEVTIEDQKYITPVNLIVIGFEMQSFEFNVLFAEHLPANSKVYFINLGVPATPTLPSQDPKLQENTERFVNMFKDTNLIKVVPNAPELQLDKIMFELWQNIHNAFDRKYSPRSILRHKLLSKVFKEHTLINADSSIEYLKDRTWIELVLSISKYKGFVSFNQLVNDRFGKYFSLYRKELEDKISKKGSNLFNELIYPRTIANFCKELKLTSIGYSSKAYLLSNNPNVSTVDESTFEKYIPKLFNLLLSKLNVRTRGVLTELQPLYDETLLDLYRKEDSEVSPKYDNSYQSLFLKPKLIKSSLALDYITRHLFEELKWDTLFIIAESGEWLVNKIGKLQSKKEVIMVVADDAKEAQLNESIKHLEIHKLKWWLHNQHMTIFLSGDKPNLKPLRAIYFVRRHRNSHIHPIIIDNPDDCRLILETFAAYCKKSYNIKTYTKNKIPTHVRIEDINDFFRNYLKKL